MVIDAGERRYELVEGWGQLPDGWAWGQVAAVAIDSADNVHVFGRSDHPYLVFDRAGKLLDHWGEGLFEHAHGLCITDDDSVFFIEHDAHVINKFDKAGRHRLTLGRRNKPSDTGFTREVREPADALARGEIAWTDATPTINGVTRGGPPFNRPTDLSVSATGDIYVSDGYNNCKVHRFAADGTLLQSWGEPGDARDLRDTVSEPGRFHTVHGIWVHSDRVFACDRENNRIQVFTLDGRHLVTWTGYLRPTKIYIAPDEEIAYVSELNDRVTIADLDGNVIGRWGDQRSHEPGKFWGPHGIWRDSENSVYVSEVLEGRRLQKFARVS